MLFRTRLQSATQGRKSEITGGLLDTTLEIDLGTEMLLAAEKETMKIAVEVKSFLKDSLITDFYLALGQIIAYQVNLALQEPERVLYLALSEATYHN